MHAAHLTSSAGGNDRGCTTEAEPFRTGWQSPTGRGSGMDGRTAQHYERAASR